MNSRNPLRRRLFVSALVIITGIGTWSRLTGTENIRAIHILTLIAIGVGIGIFLTGLFALIRKKEL